MTFLFQEVLPKVFYFKFNSLRNMALALGRVQDHAEHPYFKGKVFSLEEIVDYYHERDEDYFNSSDGFNIPASAFKAFWEGLFEISPEETEVLEVLGGHVTPQDDFYVIATADKQDPGDGCAYDHELAHALWYTQPEYQEEMLSVMKEYSLVLEDLKYWLESWGCYGFEVMEDEIQAYLSTDSEPLLIHRFQLREQGLQLSSRLKSIFKHWVKSGELGES
jgi:hypothetical protein